VSTASKSQVRQPIYQSSVGAWRRFEARLGPLAKALGNAVTPADTSRKQQETAAAWLKSPGRHFTVRARSLKVERQNGAWVLAGAKGAAPVPPGLDRQVSWIVDRRAFTEGEFAEAFPQTGDEVREQLLKDLSGMKVVAEKKP
jgi:hypothetical protein